MALKLVQYQICMTCLRLMGESNAVNIRQPRLKDLTWEATKKAYRNIITEEERDSGYLPATFQATSL